jgi:type I restriction-modification system DNA methylase subunit
MLPALKIRISDVIEEYNNKVLNAENIISETNNAINKLREAACVKGRYVESVGSFRMPCEREIKKNLLKSAWWHVYDELKIADYTSAKDRESFKFSMSNPPEFTLENLMATFGKYASNPREHILRSLAEVFTSLDPAYKSHSKVKIGVKGLPKRVIITNMTASYSYGRERFKDMVNALATYQGVEKLSHSESNLVCTAFKTMENVTLDRGLTIKPFQNGNAHVIFDDKSLLDINRALAEFYGDVLPDAPEDPMTKSESTSVSKDLQYYPTPKAVIDRILDVVGIYDGRKLNVLEPSCGCGRIMDEIVRLGSDCVGVEYDLGRAKIAKSKGHNVHVANFLEVPPDAKFDVVVMNPPFYGKHYAKHVKHAMKFLKDGGRLVTVLPATSYYDHKELEIKNWTDLPVGSFSESGTNVPTGYAVFRNS